MKYVKIIKVLRPTLVTDRLLNQVVLVQDDNTIHLIEITYNLSDFEYIDIPMNEIDDHLVYIGITESPNGIPYKTYE